MCGLTGILNVACDQTADQLQTLASRMADRLHHRGPDDTGIWYQPANGIALAFKRLSIVDLTPTGHQPMSSSDGRFVIVFNGEIYNHQDLRSELTALGRSFRGRSDTEVLIEGFTAWGIESTLQRSIGMFAIAVWDLQQRELTLARDRLGKKPLYYGRFGSTLLFASETKALRAHPAFQAEIDRRQVGEFLKYSYLPHGSIYQDVHSLEPGCLTAIRFDDDRYWSGQAAAIETPYWSFTDAAKSALDRPCTVPYQQASEQLDALLTDAVGRRMLADVPLGAFLSGGIDSSLVVSLMQKQSSRPIKTFTIGFEEEAYNEAPYAKQVAEHLRTEHTELYVTSRVARDVIPRLPTLFDEPFADSSQIPTFLVSQLARQHVTVALSGDGGDEVFSGYRRYFDALDGFFTPDQLGGPLMGDFTSRLARISRSLPSPVRRTISSLSRLIGQISPRRDARMFSFAGDLFSDLGPHYRYLRNMSHWHDDEAVQLGIPMSDRHRIVHDIAFWRSQLGSQPAALQQAWQAFDTVNYLPGDILTKVDRASMGVSLECRAPLLDHRVVDFAWSLPQVFKVEGRTGKRILRTVLSKYVPSELFERPKVGFGVPIDAWLRGPLKEWAEDLLDESRLRREGFFNPVPIRRKWAQHRSGQADWHYQLWDVLMFQAWLAEQTRPRVSGMRD